MGMIARVRVMKFGKRHYRPQVDQMDCGVASLAMVFGYYGSYYFLETRKLIS
ncbi:competence factor transporting ATP-binding protein/permease ComA [Streptococcus pneumoniae]|nr:competence factor transporting ATP-binding protein/permease ComA [Streptococcus pneumoniae]